MQKEEIFSLSLNYCVYFLIQEGVKMYKPVQSIASSLEQNLYNLNTRLRYLES